MEENLRFFAGPYELRHPDGRIARALEVVNLSGRANDPCGSLSRGLRQRLCDRVAIITTALRTIGRPQDFRAQLFTATPLVRTRQPPADPEQLFAAVPGVQDWQSDATRTYTLTVTDPEAVAPQLTRALVEAGADVLSIGEGRHSLEDVHLQLVDEDVEAAKR